MVKKTAEAASKEPKTVVVKSNGKKVAVEKAPEKSVAKITDKPISKNKEGKDGKDKKPKSSDKHLEPKKQQSKESDKDAKAKKAPKEAKKNKESKKEES